MPFLFFIHRLKSNEAPGSHRLDPGASCINGPLTHEGAPTRTREPPEATLCGCVRVPPAGQMIAPTEKAGAELHVDGN